MYKLMDDIVKQVSRVSLMCCTHMALLGTKLMVRHDELLKTISQRLVDEISIARLKVLDIKYYVIRIY